jgi:hypothetical protein
VLLLASLVLKERELVRMKLRLPPGKHRHPTRTISVVGGARAKPESAKSLTESGRGLCVILVVVSRVLPVDHDGLREERTPASTRTATSSNTCSCR